MLTQISVKTLLRVAFETPTAESEKSILADTLSHLRTSCCNATYAPSSIALRIRLNDVSKGKSFVYVERIYGESSADRWKATISERDMFGENSSGQR